MVFTRLKNVIVRADSKENLFFLQGFFIVNLYRKMYYKRCAEEAPDLWGDYSHYYLAFSPFLAEEAPDLWGDYSIPSPV